jgi:thiamine-phosphate pyrophosphorylase
MDGVERRERLDAARLYLVSGARPGGRPLAEVLRAALRGGVDIVQLRCKTDSDDVVLAAAAEARALCASAGALLLVGLSTHAPAEVDAADADYIGVGPVHATPTKPGRPAVGLDLVRHAAAHADLPWFAIGGIDAGCVDAVAAAGATRIAVVRAITEAPDPEAAARALRAALPTEVAAHGG